MNKKNTHLIFDGKKIIISPDLGIVFSFLMEIEKEVESLLGIEKKLNSIRKQHQKTLSLVSYLAKKIKENNIEIKFNLSEKPESIATKLELHVPIRSQIIVLFSNLETLFCLNIAYQEQTDDDEKIRKFAMKPKIVKKFLNSYCLTNKNEYYKKYKKRFSKISAKQLRSFRNSLIHFFSLGTEIGIISAALDDKARRLEKILEKNGKKSIFISPEDLYEIIKKAGKLMLEEWNSDSSSNEQKFKKKIIAVKSVIEKNGAVIVDDEQLDI